MPSRTRHEWTPHEDQVLRAAWKARNKNLPISRLDIRLAKQFGVTQTAVSARRSRLGLKTNHPGNPNRGKKKGHPRPAVRAKKAATVPAGAVGDWKVHVMGPNLSYTHEVTPDQALAILAELWKG